jgi:hypothetical protein
MRPNYECSILVLNNIVIIFPCHVNESVRSPEDEVTKEEEGRQRKGGSSTSAMVYITWNTTHIVLEVRIGTRLSVVRTTPST